jgi:hypothetical protein
MRDKRTKKPFDWKFFMVVTTSSTHRGDDLVAATCVGTPASI